MMTEQEKLLKAKIPGPETGIEIKHSICDICTPGAHCGLDVFVKDGTILKVEGTEGFPGSNGKLCTKGACNREYVYRKDRIKTPLRRIGPRGSGQFEPVSWDTAYTEIAEKLNAIKKEHGPEVVAWYTGYPKWYRPWLHRMAYSFGSLNYGTESSSCFRATDMAWKTVAGRNFRPDLANAKVYLGWGSNELVNFYIPGRGLAAFKERGGKIIIVDPRVTPTSQRLADIHLQLRPGTDGALALGMANLMFQKGWADLDFLQKYTHGLKEYQEYVRRFTLAETERITGVPKEKILAAVELIATEGPTASYMPSATITHHINGYNNMRAIITLLAVTGNIDRKGGMLPIYPTYVYADCGFETMEERFIDDKLPKDSKPKIGAKRFPVWNELVNEFQAMDLVRQVNEGTPYPVKALMAFGMNNRMFPQPQDMLDCFENLDLVVATDLAMTDVCNHADYVLPVCTSLERSELKSYPGGFMTCTTPAIQPLYESKCDPEIICDLAEYLKLDDDLLRAGYDETMRFMISNLSETLEDLREAPLPVKVKEFAPRPAGGCRENGFSTKTGKVELYSELIAGFEADYPQLDPLPTYRESFDDADVKEYPLTLVAGARLPNAIHSRLHTIPWARSLRRDPAADLHPDTAAACGVKDGEDILLSTASGSICVKAHLTRTVRPGDVFMYHGYKEADVNSLIGSKHLDPYSGFPGFRQSRCSIRKAGE